MNKAVKYLFLVMLTCMLTIVPASVLAATGGHSNTSCTNLTYSNSNSNYSNTQSNYDTGTRGVTTQAKTTSNTQGYTAIPGSGGISSNGSTCNANTSNSGTCGTTTQPKTTSNTQGYTVIPGSGGISSNGSTCNANTCANGTSKGTCTTNDTCADGTCDTGTCANGTCNTGTCANGTGDTGTCADGSCDITSDDNDTAAPSANSYNNIFSMLRNYFGNDQGAGNNQLNFNSLIPQKTTTVTTLDTTPAYDQSNAQLTDEYALEVIDLVNQERAQEGLSPLAIDATLCQATAIRVKEIQTSFSHTRPDGSSCFTALSQVNAQYMSAGENIAIGQASPQAVVTAWMNSPGHRANIMNPSFTHIGVASLANSGGTYGGYAWAQFFTD